MRGSIGVVWADTHISIAPHESPGGRQAVTKLGTSAWVAPFEERSCTFAAVWWPGADISSQRSSVDKGPGLLLAWQACLAQGGPRPLPGQRSELKQRKGRCLSVFLLCFYFFKSTFLSNPLWSMHQAVCPRTSLSSLGFISKRRVGMAPSIMSPFLMPIIAWQWTELFNHHVLEETKHSYITTFRVTRTRWFERSSTKTWTEVFLDHSSACNLHKCTHFTYIGPRILIHLYTLVPRTTIKMWSIPLPSNSYLSSLCTQLLHPSPASRKYSSGFWSTDEICLLWSFLRMKPYRLYSFLWLPSSACCFWESSMLWHVSVVPFLLLNSILRYGCPTVCFIYSPVDGRWGCF